MLVKIYRTPSKLSLLVVVLIPLVCSIISLHLRQYPSELHPHQRVASSESWPKQAILLSRAIRTLEIEAPQTTTNRRALPTGVMTTSPPTKINHSDSAVIARQPTNSPQWARDRHTCRQHFIDICGKTPQSQFVFNKSLLVPKWPKPLKIAGLREAIAEHNERQKKACEGKLADPRLLVFTCRRGSGGLGSGCHALADGYRGVTLGFVLAVLEKRSFFMHTPTWLQFEKIFPFRLNLPLDNCPALAKPETMNAISRHHITFNMGSDSDKTGACANLGQAGLRGAPERVLGLNGNQIYECWYRLLRETGHQAERVKHESVMRLVWENMFDFPGKGLEDMFQKFVKSEKVNLEESVCIHVRSGSFKGLDDGCFYQNFDDVWRCARALELASDRLSSLQRTTWVIIGDNDLHKQMAIDYIENCSKSDRLFFQSSVQRRFVDTRNFGRLASTIVLSGVEEQRRVFFDLLVMSRCRHLVAMQSGFSGMAAILHRDRSERHFVRVNKFSKPMSNINKVCVSELGYDYG